MTPDKLKDTRVEDIVTDTALHRYVEVNLRYYKAYEAYEPALEVIAQINERYPRAHVVTPSRYGCPDCMRNVPRMARIAEHLPGWTWDIFNDKELERKEALEIQRIPTFIVYDQSTGLELGRIVENPVSGSLEQDLLAIVSAT
jgi:hypothetical protein